MTAGYKPDYWDGVRTGENDGEEPFPTPCREWQCKRGHDDCVKAGRCLNDAAGVLEVPKNG